MMKNEPNESMAEFSRVIEIDHLPAKGMALTETAQAEECTALTKRYKIDALNFFRLTAQLTPWRKRGVRIKAHIEAKMTRQCVVTLESFEQEVKEDFELLMLPEEMMEPVREDDMDAPEALIDGKVDIGELGAQYLALAIDPYPKKSDAVFSHIEDAAPDAMPDSTKDKRSNSPFAILGALKNKNI